jgi:hypothetical protein
MSWLAKVVEHSVSAEHGEELITFQLRYPRFVHAEFMTHRVFSRNASSSRAIPVAKMIEQVRNEPAMPVHWGKNQPGMQARAEVEDIERAKALWLQAARDAADTAQRMMDMGLHKQVANRILEPFQWINVIVTATEWANFFALRDHEDADPNMKKLAGLMSDARAASTNPQILLSRNAVNASGWHLPWITQAERWEHFDDPRFLAKLSTARNARVSYLNHDGTTSDPQKDLGLFDKLVGSAPLHASPTEHPAYALPEATWCKNFRGFHQFRADVEAQFA